MELPEDQEIDQLLEQAFEKKYGSGEKLKSATETIITTTTTDGIDSSSSVSYGWTGRSPIVLIDAPGSEKQRNKNRKEQS